MSDVCQNCGQSCGHDATELLANVAKLKENHDKLFVTLMALLTSIGGEARLPTVVLDAIAKTNMRLNFVTEGAITIVKALPPEGVEAPRLVLADASTKLPPPPGKNGVKP